MTFQRQWSTYEIYIENMKNPNFIFENKQVIM